MKHFYVVLDAKGNDRHKMKQYLRKNPDLLPGLDPSNNTSHKLRNALKKKGWAVQETQDEVLLTPPGVTLPPPVIDPPEDEDPPEAEFTLEYQLRDFLAQNLETILVDGKKLRVYVDPSDRDGVEFPTDVGPIDILAVDDETGDFVVFELKRASSPDRAIGQLSRYMGWVKQTVGKGQKVRGVIVAKTISQNLRYAVLVVPNVSLFEYEVRFTLKAASGL